jgi:UDP-N-acetylglucosamine 2-epimerase (non-hydrolysing)
MKTILTVIGTRPEAIKLAPVLYAIDQSNRFASKVCLTRQHTDLVDPFIINLKIAATYLLKKEARERALYQCAAQILGQFGEVLEKSKPDLVIVQGDTTTAFACALAAFYASIPVAHIEAGLRTGSIQAPWPEEAHRCMVDLLTTYFFAPTEQAKKKLLLEGTPTEKIWVVGNTSIDSIRLALNQTSKLPYNSKEKKIVVTVHRRENHGTGLKKVCSAMSWVAKQFPNIRIQFFLHPNPNIRNAIIQNLSGFSNIDLLEPMDHFSFIKNLNESLFVVTDSGGVQEETSILGKPVLIVRDTTERPESVLAGTSKIVGTDFHAIVKGCKELIENEQLRVSMSKVHFSYGDGYAAQKIVSVLERELYNA